MKNVVKLSERAMPADSFDIFWQEYPRRIAKKAARMAYQKAIKHTPPEDIISGAATFASYCERFGKEMQYIPHPATWLNGERWEDDLESELPKSGADIFDKL